MRLTLNAKAAINKFRVSLKRVYYNDKLQGASDENALRAVHTQANELELMALTPLAHHLANLFTTPNELPNVTSAKEWERLSSKEFWIHALLSESCRFNRELAKAADTKDDTKYQSRGVVNMQATTDVVNPALTTLPLQQAHIYFPVGFLDVVLPKLTSPPYMMNMREQPAGSPVLAQTANHYITPPDALMPHTPVCNEMYEAGLLNPAVADRIWYTYKCNLKLAVTMFKSEELECCINSLSARRLVVPKPAPASSTAQTIWLLTQAQMDMGTVAQQQQNRKVDMHFIQDPDSVLRTDGCYCTRPRVELAQRLHYGEITGPAEKCSLYLPKEPIRPSQLREIFQYSPANLVALPLQRALIEQASHPERQAVPLPAAPRAKPKFRPYGHVPSNQRPIGRPY